MPTRLEDSIDPFFLAVSKFRRRQYDECIDRCSLILAENPYDKAVWLLKCRALTAQQYMDDTELEEQGIGDLLLDDSAMATVPRPGTSLNHASECKESDGSGGPSQSVRPLTTSGRLLTGFKRPATNAGSASLEEAVKNPNRPGTSRPVTTLGRQVRLGTASLMATGAGPFIDVSSVDLRKYGSRPSIGKALCDYLIYHEHNPTKALELASEATVFCNYDDWWWKARLGKCYYQLNLLRDAERQFHSALNNMPTISVYLELGKVYLRMDQPRTALDIYTKALEHFPNEVQILLAIARTYEALNDAQNANLHYKRVVTTDPSCVEAIANLASHNFYTDQPEVALRYYRRLVQMGISNAELWNNLGMCCFYASQYDMTLSCMEKALSLANDDVMPDIWFNIGQIAISLADLGLAYQAFKVATHLDPTHAPSLNNLGALEIRKGNIDAAQLAFEQSKRNGAHMYEPYFNAGLVHFKNGEFEESFQNVEVSRDLYAKNPDAIELLGQLKALFA